MKADVKSGFYIYFIGLILLAIGLPLSLFLTSVSQFVIAASLLFLPKEKFTRFLSNKTAMLIAGIWIMHVIGLLWTNNLSEGLKDLRIKLPLLILPITIAGNPKLSLKYAQIVLIFFISAVTVGSLISMAVLKGIIPREVNDIRDIFIFNISHIRFALFTCLSIISLLYLSFKNNWNPIYKFFAIAVSVWLIIFLFICESITGLLILSLPVFLVFAVPAFKRLDKTYKAAISLVILALPVLALIYFNSLMKEVAEIKSFPLNVTDKTSRGNAYQFALDNNEYENGFPVWSYVCEDELRNEWNTRSLIKYDSLDQRNQQLRNTLIRFMTSKGLKKDADGVKSLSDDDIRLVEHGVANIKYKEISSIHSRIYQIAWEIHRYQNGGNPSGHSVTQRLEFWRAALYIIGHNMLIGVGTGDLKDEFEKSYRAIDSKLLPEFRLRSHNQYLSIAAAFGIAGLMYFLFALLYPLKKYSGFLLSSFYLILLLSMLTEDTLETQAGATFAGFFIAFFLFSFPLSNDEQQQRLQAE